MRLLRFLATALLALTLTGCAATLTKIDTNPWLDARAGSNDYDVSGRWDTGGSWGATGAKPISSRMAPASTARWGATTSTAR